MALSYGQFTLWVSVSYVGKSEPSCTSHKPRASYQRWQVWWGLQHGKCPHVATQSYIFLDYLGFSEFELLTWTYFASKCLFKCAFQTCTRGVGDRDHCWSIEHGTTRALHCWSREIYHWQTAKKCFHSYYIIPDRVLLSSLVTCD